MTLEPVTDPSYCGACETTREAVVLLFGRWPLCAACLARLKEETTPIGLIRTQTAARCEYLARVRGDLLTAEDIRSEFPLIQAGPKRQGAK